MGFSRNLFGMEEKRIFPDKCAYCGGNLTTPPPVDIVGVSNVRNSDFRIKCENCGQEYHLRCLNYLDVDGFLFASCPDCGSSIGVM